MFRLDHGLAELAARRAIVDADGSGAPIDDAIDQIHQIENRKRAA